MPNFSDTDHEQNLIEYLQNSIKHVPPSQSRTNWKYNNLEELVLRAGKIMRPMLDTAIEPLFPKQCYQNSQSLLECHPSLIYCEGYAVKHSLLLPVPHGWLVNKGGQVIDVTWNAPASYIGIAFKRNWLKTFLAQRKRQDCIAILENNYLEKFSFLKDGLPATAVHSVMTV